MSIDENNERYRAAAHAMQSGVAIEMGYDEAPTTPKHLRVGVNSALVNEAALARLLIEKNVITGEEYYQAIADEMERERDRYATELTRRLGRPVTLG